MLTHKTSSGPRWLLVYENRSGVYRLVFNQTGSGGVSDISRGQMIDYFGNESRQMLIIFGGRMVLLGYRSGAPMILQTLSEAFGYGFAVGDVNHDGRPDIVHKAVNGFAVLENLGGGMYNSILAGQGSWESPYFADEIRVGDVDGDGLNEIVMVGCCTPAPVLSVWENVHGGYERLFSYFTDCPYDEKTGGAGIQSVEICDLDRNGASEIITATESGCTRGVVIWEYNKMDDSWLPLWEDETTRIEKHPVSDMLTLRALVDGNATMLLGLGRSRKEGSPADTVLYILEKEDTGFRSARRLLWEGGSAIQNLDVWTPSFISESTDVMLAMLAILILLCSMQFNLPNTYHLPAGQRDRGPAHTLSSR